MDDGTAAHYTIVNGAGVGPISVLSLAEHLLHKIGPYPPDSQRLFDEWVERQGY
jgi:hypothetical protein